VGSAKSSDFGSDDSHCFKEVKRSAVKIIAMAKQKGEVGG
jgi:hypothetical protein